MARFALFLLASLIVTVLPATSRAGDLFTGFEIDSKSQYFGYAGVRIPTLQMSGGTTLFAQMMTAGLGYRFKSSGQLLDTNVQFIVPSLGISQTLGGWKFSALAGPQLRRIEEERLNTTAQTDHQVGVFGQAEAMYWHEKGSVHAIGSYADLDNFFWGRLRGKRLVHQLDRGCCKTYVGWDVTGMGNAEFRAVKTGPLVEFSVGNVFVLFKGGYQHNTTFQSGAYGGVELYTAF